MKRFRTRITRLLNRFARTHPVRTWALLFAVMSGIGALAVAPLAVLWRGQITRFPVMTLAVILAVSAVQATTLLVAARRGMSDE